jgi:hypothetical protein
MNRWATTSKPFLMYKRPTRVVKPLLKLRYAVVSAYQRCPVGCCDTLLVYDIVQTAAHAHNNTSSHIIKRMWCRCNFWPLSMPVSADQSCTGLSTATPTVVLTFPSLFQNIGQVPMATVHGHGHAPDCVNTHLIARFPAGS